MFLKFYFIFPIGLCALLYFFSGGSGVSPRHHPGRGLTELPSGCPGSSTRALLPGWWELNAVPAQAAVRLRLLVAPHLNCWDPHTWASWWSRGTAGHIPGQIILGAVFFLNLLSWPEFCSATSSCVSFCEPQSLPPQHGWIGEPLPCSVVWSVSPSGKLELLRASLHLFFFFPFWFHCAACCPKSEDDCFIYFVWFSSWLLWEGKCGLCYFIMSEGEVSFNF